jgi:hypothetical protein
MKKLLIVGMTLISTLVSGAASATSMKRYETFRMYRDIGHVPSQTCDVGTSLTIDYATNTATLREFVGGICELYVAPNERSYQLSEPLVNAAGRHYIGESQTVSGATIALVDYRGSTLRIYRPSPLKLTETRADGTEVVLHAIREHRPLSN